jgi:hypothetical protein
MLFANINVGAFLRGGTGGSVIPTKSQNLSERAGFGEILEALELGPKSSAQLLEVLRAELGVRWQTDAQVRWRVLWLANLGIAEEDSGSWRLPLAGLSVPS